ncbi:MAG: hypothetical protein SV966_06250 [Actinomycetota bacterium]|nr:hypothetical protein [Actinomycetota bacterium]
MSTITKQFRGGLTRLQVGTAACAVAAAAAFPAVVANAEPSAPMPLAPVTQMIDGPLSPVVDFAQRPDLEEWLEIGRTKIDEFRPLVFVTRVALAPVVLAAATPQLIAMLASDLADALYGVFHPGPYGTGG